MNRRSESSLWRKQPHNIYYMKVLYENILEVSIMAKEEINYGEQKNYEKKK